MESIMTNIFHITLVSALLVTLATNLHDGPMMGGLRNTTYIVVVLMVVFHSYKISKKLKAE